MPSPLALGSIHSSLGPEAHYPFPGRPSPSSLSAQPQPGPLFLHLAAWPEPPFPLSSSSSPVRPVVTAACAMTPPTSSLCATFGRPRHLLPWPPMAPCAHCRQLCRPRAPTCSPAVRTSSLVLRLRHERVTPLLGLPPRHPHYLLQAAEVVAAVSLLSPCHFTRAAQVTTMTPPMPVPPIRAPNGSLTSPHGYKRAPPLHLPCFPHCLPSSLKPESTPRPPLPPWPRRRIAALVNFSPGRRHRAPPGGPLAVPHLPSPSPPPRQATAATPFPSSPATTAGPLQAAPSHPARLHVTPMAARNPCAPYLPQRATPPPVSPHACTSVRPQQPSCLADTTPAPPRSCQRRQYGHRLLGTPFHLLARRPATCLPAPPPRPCRSSAAPGSPFLWPKEANKWG